MIGLIDFSIDAASNDSGAPPILFAEGQPANTVNNSMREVLAALARWHADTAGALVAMRGTSDAYAIATNQVFSAVTAAKAHTLSFTVDAEDQGPATLAPDGQPARPVFRPLGRQLGPGDLAPNVAYTARYQPGAGAYFIVAPFIERPGKIAPQGDLTPDPGWLVADGSAKSRTAYAALFAQIGVTYGSGDGSTTFNLPNGNTRALFGPGGVLGGVGSTGGVETVTLTTAQMPSHAHGGTTGAAGGHSHTGTTNAGGGHTHSGSTSIAGTHAHAIQFTQASTYQAGGGGAATAIGALYPTGTPNAGGQTDGNGAHQHTLAVDAVGDHQHGFSTNGVADHGHTIGSDGNHQHGIAAALDHTHTLTMSSAGADGAHTNMPPGLVVQFVIKA